MKSSSWLTFLALMPSVVCALALHAWGQDLSPTDTTVQAAAFSCFCTELKAERHAEAEKNGVSGLGWPDVDRVESCVETTLHTDHDTAHAAWLELRVNGQLRGKGSGDTLTLCSAAGYDVAETTPEPASEEVMSAARKIYCKMITSGPDHVPSEAQMQRALMVPYHISKKQAGVALDRAAVENTAGTFACPGQ